MKWDKNLLKQRWFGYTVAACSAVVLYLLLTNLGFYAKRVAEFFDIVSPVIVGIIIAYLLSPLCGFFEHHLVKHLKNKRICRILAVIIVLLGLGALIAILLIAFVPQLIASIGLLVSNLSGYLTNLGKSVERLSENIGRLDIDAGVLIEKSAEYVNQLIQKLPDSFDGIVTKSFQVGMSVTNFLLGAVVAIYFLLDEARMTLGLKKLFRAILKTKDYHNFALFWRKCNSIMLRYLGFDILDGVIVGMVNFVFMLITKMPYAALVSVVVGVTNLAPTFGPVFGALIGGFILVLVNPVQALIFLIFTVILQVVDGYIIKPKLFGSSLGVPAVWILISIIVGGKMFGVTGILLAIPIASIINYVYEDYLEKKIENRRLRQIEDGKDYLREIGDEDVFEEDIFPEEKPVTDDRQD